MPGHPALVDSLGLLSERAGDVTGRVYTRLFEAYPELEWLTLSTRKNPPGAGANLRREGDGDGPLVGERVVFTGALQVARRDAADMAHAAGAAVEPNVTKKTTLLIVGDQDIDRLAGHKKSSKHRKAEDLIKAGLPLRILGEADFMHICTAE